MKQKQRKGKIKISLRLKIAVLSIITLCTACCLSCVLVVAGFYYYYDGPITPGIAIILCLIVCTFTMIFGGLALWHVTRFITNPIIKISEGVQKVADGDFLVQLALYDKIRGLKSNKEGTKDSLFTDEIDELAENFNKMALELHGMDYMRKDFMSNVSHEIKTPVAAITGFSEILLDGGLEEQEQKEYLTYLNLEAVRLSRLCDSMLRMSRLDNQMIVDNKKEVMVDEQIRRCIISLGEIWSDKQINYDLQLDKCNIICDYDLLYQIWTNLIDNAIKYSKQGGTIRIKASMKKYILKVSVEDDGIGIASEKLCKIYDKFYQCEESHKKQGSGLGLSIVKRIVELLNGTITCESEEGKGTRMTVELPVGVRE